MQHWLERGALLSLLTSYGTRSFRCTQSLSQGVQRFPCWCPSSGMPAAWCISVPCTLHPRVMVTSQQSGVSSMLFSRALSLWGDISLCSSLGTSSIWINPFRSSFLSPSWCYPCQVYYRGNVWLASLLGLNTKQSSLLATVCVALEQQCHDLSP